MKVVILAGGFGTRLSEETDVRPKPMVEIGGKPILWHIMNIYDTYGFNEFVIALGYKKEVIKEYFLNFYAFNNDISVDLKTGNSTIHDGNQPDWRIHLVDTGLNTQTGGRLRRLRNWLGSEESFMMTYGDGLADINLNDLVNFHKSHSRLATVTVVRPPSRFGEVLSERGQVTEFNEKPQTDAGWINGGFFVLDRKVLDYIDGDDVPWETRPLRQLAVDGQLMAFEHRGFWQPMDTLREKRLLENLWSSGQAPWKLWDKRGRVEPALQRV